MEIIPNISSGRGSFSNLQPAYDARHDGEWVSEFVEVLEPRNLGLLRRDADETIPLVMAVHQFTYGPSPLVDNPIVHGFTHGSTVGSALGYIVLEMLVRRLTPALDDWGFLTRHVPGFPLEAEKPVSGLRSLFELFELTTPYRALRRDLRVLNERMKSSEYNRKGQIEELNLYGRLEKGRNLLIHGNLTHSFEATLLVLMIDLILLHVMLSQVGHRR